MGGTQSKQNENQNVDNNHKNHEFISSLDFNNNIYVKTHSINQSEINSLNNI
jgi:hypothetical protein